MKKIYLLTVLLIFGALTFLPALEEIQLGRIYFPRDFVHGGKDFAKGSYHLTLLEKEGVPTFLVKDKKSELLFEEMAVLKPFEGKNKNFKHRIGKELLKGYEYFRVKVTTPETLYMAYFLLKK